MTERSTHASPKLEPLFALRQAAPCFACSKALPVGELVARVIRANPSREAVCCARCWREANVCACCHREITPEIEHFLRWLPQRSMFMAWCLMCAAQPGLEQLRSIE
jgi:hypothetical protein